MMEIANAYDVKVYLHTVNDILETRKYINEQGVTGIFTDYIYPNEVYE